MKPNRNTPQSFLEWLASIFTLFPSNEAMRERDKKAESDKDTRRLAIKAHYDRIAGTLAKLDLLVTMEPQWSDKHGCAKALLQDGKGHFYQFTVFDDGRFEVVTN